MSSPGGSSTASGPTYARPAGFEHHAQEILVSKGGGAKAASAVSGFGGGATGAGALVLSRHALKDTLNSKGAKKKKSLLSADLKEGIAAATKKIHGIPVSHSGGTKAKSRKGGGTRSQNLTESMALKNFNLPHAVSEPFCKLLFAFQGHACLYLPRH